MNNDPNPLVSPHYDNTVSTAMEIRCKDRDELSIDGILTTLGDYIKIANEWKGTTVHLCQIHPTVRQSEELAKWKGMRMELSPCDTYVNLHNFVYKFNNWKGNTLVIGYTDIPDLLDKYVKNPKYKKLVFDWCDFDSNETIERIKRDNPGLIVEVIEKTACDEGDDEIIVYSDSE